MEREALPSLTAAVQAGGWGGTDTAVAGNGSRVLGNASLWHVAAETLDARQSQRSPANAAVLFTGEGAYAADSSSECSTSDCESLSFSLFD